MSGSNVVGFKGIPFHEAEIKEKECAECGAVFTPRSGVHKYCSLECKQNTAYRNHQSTDNQYKSISGNWNRYFDRLLSNARRKLDWDGLSREDLLNILEEQEGRCALTGVKLTCYLEKGIIFRTNVSIDRILPGGPYNYDNVRLVCSLVNKMRLDLTDEELYYWCRKIIEGGE